MGIFEKFKLGFKKSADSISSGLREIIVKKEIDDETLNKIEEFLISSDVGIDASAEIKSIISKRKIDPKKNIVEEINLILKEYILELMVPLERKDFFGRGSSAEFNGSTLFGDFGLNMTWSQIRKGDKTELLIFAGPQASIGAGTPFISGGRTNTTTVPIK